MGQGVKLGAQEADPFASLRMTTWRGSAAARKEKRKPRGGAEALALHKKAAKGRSEDRPHIGGIICGGCGATWLRWWCSGRRGE
jgi:hypothetical protein